MRVVTIEVSDIETSKRRMKAAFLGKAQVNRISFVSFELLWKVLTPKRMALLHALAGTGPLAIRELARRIGRDVRAVHADVHTLLHAGVIDKTDDGKIEFPYDAVHVDFTVSRAA